MKLSSRQLSLVIAGTALAFAGCTKKPDRPDPGATVMGQQGFGTTTNTGGGVTTSPFDPNTPAIPDRSSEWGPGGQNPSILAAQTVYFEFDRSDIRASEREKLKAAKDYLDKNPTHKLLLQGRCDWRGTDEYNLALGDRRANASKRYLQSLGVPATRLETISKGSLDAAKNADDATMAKDRRVELIVVDPSRAGPPPAI